MPARRWGLPGHTARESHQLQGSDALVTATAPSVEGARVATAVGPADRAGPSAVVGDDEAYVSVHPQALSGDAAPGFDLFARESDGFVPIGSGADGLDGKNGGALSLDSVETVYVTRESAPDLWAYCEPELARIAADQLIPIGERTRTIVGVAETAARDVLASPAAKNIERAMQIGDTMARFVLDPDEGERAVSHLIGSLSDGTRLEAHSANTAAIAASMGQFGPEVNVASVAELVTAGLLHDLGLALIPSEILEKPRRLAANERRQVQQHPHAGSTLARETLEVPNNVAEAIRWHHERLDGSGYPDRLRGQAIPWMARVVAIAEVFDSLTNTQPFRERMRPPDALGVMFGELGRKLDTSLLRKFIPMLRSEPEPTADAAAGAND